MPDHVLAVIPSDPTGAGRAPEHDRIAAELACRIDGEVRFGRHDRMLYATDASLYQVEPLGVVIPRHRKDVETVVRFAAAEGLPILPRGAGTSLAGQTVNEALVLDFSVHCTRLINVDVTRRQARVEPGLVLDDLNAALAPRGLMFGPDVATSSHANLGGMIGNNSAGAHSTLYGRTVEHLVSLEVLLADGTPLTLEAGAGERDERVGALTEQVASVVRPLAGVIRERYPRTLRRVNGYNLDLVLDQIEASTPGTLDRVNLAHLLCGSEGTLGITLEATLGLVEAPRARALAIVAFDSVESALEALDPILATRPAAVELIDEMIIDLARANAECRRALALLPDDGRSCGAVLYVEHFGDERRQVRGRQDALLRSFRPERVRRFDEASEMAQAWALRKSGEPLLHGRPGARRPLTFIEDTAVDPARLAAFIAEFKRLLSTHGTRAAYYAHASVGCLHIRPLIDLRDAADRDAMERIAAEATDLVRRYGGALSGEHGDGRARSHLLERFYGPEICRAFRAVKNIFDPEGRLNPGNIVEPAPMLAHLRVQPHGETVDPPPTRTFFRFSREGGLHDALERCNGAGVCRRMTGGTMCPSYRATRDERHSTRGRGNALRLAITGQVPGNGFASAWNDPETMRTLDLCLGCKACKSECPSNVDLAKLKAEYLAHWYDAGGHVPALARFVRRMRAIMRIGSLAPGLANAIPRIPGARRASQWITGIDRRRSLPRFERSLDRWVRRGAGRGERRDAPTVVLLPECSTVYQEPAIGRAAVEVLESLGYRVVLPRAGCCGRPLLSMGLLRDAARVCRETATTWLECAQREAAVAVLGCEPGCVSAIVDDWLDLEMGLEPRALETLAAKTSLVEEFIETRWEAHPVAMSVECNAAGPPVLYHGHCHQKALWGTDRTVSLLRRLVGDRLSVLEAGCCGMAGAFGLQREHYELSLAIGELALLPAVRRAPEATIVASGTSCRHQIRDGAGRRALHPMEMLAAARPAQ